jgi:nucleolar complex protein 2
MELSALAKTDPEFYKYLQENDKELLEFNPSATDEDEDDDEDEAMQEDDDEEAAASPVLTTEILRRWQKALLEV